MKKILITLLLLLSGCSQNTVVEEEEIIDETPEEVEEIEVNPIDEIDLSLKPNELGEVMVLMYHGINQEESDWVRSVDNFKKDLQTLYDNGFRPISLNDFITGNITTEMGYTPVVLTFDDGKLDNFKLLEDGSIDPDCAVGILKDFNETHPDFPLEATFFLTGGNILFGQSTYIEEKLNMVIDLGMDLGNHTVSHPNFKDINDADTIQFEIGKMAQTIESYLHTDYTVNTMALVYGSRPDESLMNYMVRGEYKGVPYENITLLRVGSNPSVSPYDTSFNALYTPRVRASEMNTDGVGLYDYLNRYDERPELKFISDGNPDIITILEEDSNQLNTDLDKEIYAY